MAMAETEQAQPFRIHLAYRHWVQHPRTGTWHEVAGSAMGQPIGFTTCHTPIGGAWRGLQSINDPEGRYCRDCRQSTYAQARGERVWCEWDGEKYVRAEWDPGERYEHQ